MLAHEIEKGT